MQFSKMHGLGNDFMVVDAVTQNVFFSPELIRRLSDRHLGVGFDQLLVVEPPYDPELDFHYRIFNADGSEVSQCGNGARCFARFVRLKGLTNKRDIRVSTANGRMVLSVTEDELVRVNMGEPNFEPAQVPFRANKAEKTYIMRAAEQTILCGVVSMGNPHCVIQVDNVDTAAVETLGPVLESHERFPERANIGFMQVVRREHIRLRVYERGAGETRACGSGACAAVAVGIQQGLLAEEVRVELPGGRLDIAWKGGSSVIHDWSGGTYLRRIYPFMKQPEEELQETLTELDDRAVVDYLRHHPEFFIRNAHAVEAMRVPHPVRGTVSLVEWHMARARNHINVLEENMTLLMEQTHANESLFYRLLHLQSRLVAADSLDEMLVRFHRWARDLGLAGATLRLFPDRWRLGAPSRYTHLALNRQAFEPLRIQRLGQSQHYLGPLNGPELLVVLPEAKAVGSVAMSMMGSDGDLGVILFSSRDPHHYQPGQGTQLLQEIALMLPELLERWIKRV